MIRKWLTILSLIGLSIGVMLWVSGHHGLSYFGVPNGPGKTLNVLSHRGRIIIGVVEDGALSTEDVVFYPYRSRNSIEAAIARSRTHWQDWVEFEYDGLLGFDVRNGSQIVTAPDGTIQSKMTIAWVMVPHWFLVSGLAVLPIHGLVSAWRRRHRKKLGLCLKCGYDLRGSTDRCSECGHIK